MADLRELESVVQEQVVVGTRGVPGLEEVAALVRGRIVRPTTSTAGRTPAGKARPARSSLRSSHLVGPEPPTSDGRARTLDEALRLAAQLTDKGTVYLARGSEPRFQSYAELAMSAQRVLGGLRASGVRPGDPVIFQLRDNHDLVTVFWACVLGGFVATPVGIAPTYDTPNEANRRLHGAWQLLGRPPIVADDTTAAALAATNGLWAPADMRTLTLGELVTDGSAVDWWPATEDTPVLNLLTSGSTGTPKCVQHTHASIAARTWAAAQARGYTADDVSLVWMPLDHITIAMFNVRDVFLQIMHVNAQTPDFLEDPLALLRWIDRYRVTNALGSNFAYAMVNEALAECPQQDLDLSCIREFINAGEAVDPAVSHRFLRSIGGYGAAADVMTPAWGMSETCSAVTHTAQSRENEALGMVIVRRSTVSGEVVIITADDPDAMMLSTVGAPIAGVEMRIVDQHGTVATFDRTGELQVRGATMMRGYFGNPEANELADGGDGWFRTGDLAFVHDGEVVIAGRIKDQIIVRGINFPAAELEAIVERVDGVRVPYAAAAACLEPGAQRERLVVFFVPEEWEATALDRTLTDIRSAMAKEAGIAPDLMVPIAASDFLRTATGKIQRGALVAGLQEGRLHPRPMPGEADRQDTDEWLFTTTWSVVPDGREPVPPCDRTVFLGPQQLAAECGLADASLIGTTGSLADALDRAGAVPGGVDTVVFGWPLWKDENADVSLRAERLSEEFAAALAALDSSGLNGIRLVVLTAEAVVVADAGQVDLGASVLSGLTRTAAAELGHVTVSQLDLPGDRSSWPDAVRAELASLAPAADVVAYRSGKRLVRRLIPLPARTSIDAIRPGGRYVVTGGLGGIGTKLSGHLLTAHKAQLLILGRSRPAGERAAILEDLQALGAVRYRALDVADAVAVGAAVADAELEWGGRIDGIFHLAGHDPTRSDSGADGLPVHRAQRADFVESYQAKIGGAVVLGDLLRDRPDAELVLFGSVNGEFGGRGFGPYAGANAFLAAFAQTSASKWGRHVRCIGWSMWPGTGMSERLHPTAARHQGYLPIDPAQGPRRTAEVLSARTSYALVGVNAEHPAVVEMADPACLVPAGITVAFHGDGVDQEALRAAVELAVAAHRLPVVVRQVPSLSRGADGEIDRDEVWRVLAATANPDTAHDEPQTDLETTTAAVFAEVLGRDGVGRGASFFELGGNSLRASRVLRELEVRTGVRLSAHELYENPTVAGAASRIGERQAAASV